MIKEHERRERRERRRENGRDRYRYHIEIAFKRKEETVVSDTETVN